MKIKIFLILFIMHLATHFAFAQVTNIVDIGKKSTALVASSTGRGFGSAFCIDPRGYFITSAHVVRHLKSNETVKLILDSGEESEIELVAKVVRSNEQFDLALLKIGQTPDLKSLELASSQSLSETQEITAFGFPFGDLLSLREQRYPNISINKGRITSLRKSKGTLEQIQVDAMLNPGNSGGPVLNESGKVIGVVASGFEGSGVSFLVPSSRIEELLGPVIDFTPEPIAYSERYSISTFSITVNSIKPPKAPLVVELILGSGINARRISTNLQSDGVYLAKTPLIITRTQLPPVSVTVKYENGLVSGLADDINIKLDSNIVKLRDIISLRNENDSYKVVSRDEQTYISKAVQPNTITLNLGDVQHVVNFSNLSELAVHPTILDDSPIPYSVVVKSSGRILATSDGEIEITDVPVEVTDPMTIDFQLTNQIVIEAFIDGNTELRINESGIYWKSKGVNKPGRKDANYPTYVNGRKWMPKWGKPDEPSGYDTCEIYPFDSKGLGYKLELLAVGMKRGGKTIEKRDPVVLRSQNDEQVVDIPDNQSDARWYRFRLYR